VDARDAWHNNADRGQHFGHANKDAECRRDCSTSLKIPF